MKRPASAQVQRIIIKGPRDDLIQARTQNNELVDENRKLKTQIMQLKRSLQKYEHVDENLINSQFLLNRQAEQPSLIPSLKYKIRIQNNEIETLKLQLGQFQRQIKTTSIQELEFQLVQFQEESIKLKNMLNEALNMPNETKPNKYIKYLERIEELKIHINNLQHQMDAQQKDIKSYQLQIKKQQDLTSSINNEKKQMEIKHQEQLSLLKQQIQQLEKNTQEQPKLNQSQDYAQIIDQKDQALLDFQDQLNKQRKEFMSKVNSQLQFIEQQNAQLINKESKINDMSKEITSFKDQLRSIEANHQQMLSAKQTTTQSTNAPNYQQLDITIIKAELRFKLRRQLIKQSEIPKYFDFSTKKITILNIKEQLQEFPFKLNLEEAHTIALYLLSTEDSAMKNTYQLESDLPVGVLNSRLLHLLQNYDLYSPTTEGHMFSAVFARINLQFNSIVEVIKQIKRQDKSTVPLNYCSPQQLIDASKVILDDPLSTREVDYMSQLHYESTGQSEFLYLPKLQEIFAINHFPQQIKESVKPMKLISAVSYFAYEQHPIIVKPKSRLPSMQFKLHKNLKINLASVMMEVIIQKKNKKLYKNRATVILSCQFNQIKYVQNEQIQTQPLDNTTQSTQTATKRLVQFNLEQINIQKQIHIFKENNTQTSVEELLDVSQNIQKLQENMETQKIKEIKEFQEIKEYQETEEIKEIKEIQEIVTSYLNSDIWFTAQLEQQDILKVIVENYLFSFIS